MRGWHRRYGGNEEREGKVFFMPPYLADAAVHVAKQGLTMCYVSNTTEQNRLKGLRVLVLQHGGRRVDFLGEEVKYPEHDTSGG